MILYFTGTGNSRFIANEMAKILHDDVVSINDCIKNNTKIDLTKVDKYIFSLPTYGWRIPRIVTDFLENVNFNKNIDTYFVMNCGSDIGNAENYCNSLAKNIGLNYKGTEYILMPENYIAMFDSPSEEESLEIIEKAKSEITRIASVIESKESFQKQKITIGDRLKSSLVNSIFYSVIIKDKKFHVKGNCIQCGKCISICPLNNVTMENKSIHWNKNCTHCMACISICPVEAIEYGKTSNGKRRYYLK